MHAVLQICVGQLHQLTYSNCDVWVTMTKKPVKHLTHHLLNQSQWLYINYCNKVWYYDSNYVSSQTDSTKKLTNASVYFSRITFKSAIRQIRTFINHSMFLLPQFHFSATTEALMCKRNCNSFTSPGHNYTFLLDFTQWCKKQLLVKLWHTVDVQISRVNWVPVKWWQIHIFLEDHKCLLTLCCTNADEVSH